MTPRDTGVEISVVLATFDRPASLRRCLDSLIAQRVSRTFEIIVVDNNPRSGATSLLAPDFPGITWLTEPARGLSRARNRGIGAARGSVVATTDDDVIAPTDWLELLTAPLFNGATELVATTGDCLPWKLETEAEILFETYGCLRHGAEPAEFDAKWMAQWRVCFPYLWQIGTTANAAFRTSLLRDPAVGLFETRLGAGSPCGAAEDLYCFYRILKAGHGIAYLPEARLRHAHREEMTSLAGQLRGYRRGETALLTLILLRHADWRAIGQTFLWIPAWRAGLLLGELRLRLQGQRKYSLRLFWAESLAYLAGPWSLWQAHRISLHMEKRVEAKGSLA